LFTSYSVMLNTYSSPNTHPNPNANLLTDCLQDTQKRQKKIKTGNIQ